MTVGGIVVAKNRQHAVDGDSRGIGGNEHDRLLPVFVWVIGVILAHDDINCAAWVAGTTAPPFLVTKKSELVLHKYMYEWRPYRTVQHPLVALLGDS